MRQKTMMEMVDRYFDGLESETSLLTYFGRRPHENCPTYLTYILREAKAKSEKSTVSEGKA